MSAGTGQSGFGSAIYYGDTSSPSTQLAEVRDIELPNETVGDIPITHHSSPSGFAEYVPGSIMEGDSLKLTLIYVEAEYSALRAIMVAKTVKYWKWTVPGGRNHIFQGYIKSMKPNAPLDGEPMTTEMEIKVSRLPTAADS